MRLLLTSNGLTADKLIRHFKHEASREGRLLTAYLGAARRQPFDRAYYWQQRLRLAKLGSDLLFVPAPLIGADLIRFVRAHRPGALLVDDGDIWRLRLWLQEAGRADAVKRILEEEPILWVGIGAGSCIAGKDILFGSDFLFKPDGRKSDGLGLIPDQASLRPHYHLEQEKDLKHQVWNSHSQNPVVGLRDRQAVLVKNGEWFPLNAPNGLAVIDTKSAYTALGSPA